MQVIAQSTNSHEATHAEQYARNKEQQSAAIRAAIAPGHAPGPGVEERGGGLVFDAGDSIHEKVQSRDRGRLTADCFFVRCDFAALQADEALRACGEVVIVCDEDEGCSRFTVEVKEQIDNGMTGVGVEVARGFVGK